MLKHNLLIIYRNIKRHKNAFMINLVGLSTGLACFLFIYLWVNNELNFDRFHEKNTWLYQVMANHNNADRIVTMENTPDLLAETIAKELPEIEYATPEISSKLLGKFVVSIKDKFIKADGQFAGKNYFNIFSYKLIEGNKNQVLHDKNSIVISKQLAEKLFNTTENIIGKTIDWGLLNINEKAVVSGVFEDTPPNSSAQFEFVLSFEAWKDFSAKMNRPISWDNHAPSTYFTLKEGSSIEQLNKKIAGFIKAKYDNSRVTLFTRKYSDGYLYGKYENGRLVGGRIEYVRIFSIMALFILLIACINFMNLSTAKAGSRLKEIGIKKAVGADRKSLIFQFMVESTFMAFLSLVIAVVMVELFLPQFNEITGKHIAICFNSKFILLFSTIVLITGLLSGSYPALYLSRFNPVKILKSKTNSSHTELFARRGLVIFQFTLSIILIISVLVINKQVQFIQTKNPGYEKENIIYFDKEGKAAAHQESFLTELKKIPGVINCSAIGTTIIGSQSSTGGVSWEGKNPNDVTYFEEVCVDYNMLETLGIKMKEGRTFSRSFGAENSKIIFNEAAIKVMGLKNPIGKNVRHYTGTKEIIGVVKDFNFESLHEIVKPLFFRIFPEYTTKFMVKIQSGKEKETINNLQEFYKDYNPGYTFDFKFLDKDYQAQYAAEKRVEILSKCFAGLAIIISCLGLFGLVAFSSEQRTKEIGVRKVLGADTKGIVFLLSKDFLFLIFLSFIIAAPIAWLITREWLREFAYRIDINLWIFILAGSITLAIALLTISFQAIKAATANPVESLKYE